MRREFGLKVPGASNDPKRISEAEARGRAPPTLGDVPAAAETGAGKDDKFTDLDRLSGMDLERALARLTPEEERQYLAS